MTKYSIYESSEYRKLFKQLSELADLKKCAPFISHVPESWGTKKRIAWYGAATNGWEAENPLSWDFEKEREAVQHWVENERDTYQGREFWNVQAKCLSTLGLNLDDVVWGNIYKLGSVSENARGMPDTDLRADQCTLSRNLFKFEREALSPDLIVLHVGELINDHWSDFVPKWESWNRVKRSDTLLAAYHQTECQNFIWLSRRYAKHDEYVEDFKTALDAIF